MIKNFKFLGREKVKPLFQIEIMNRIKRSDESNLCWTNEFSEVIKEWLSDLYFSNEYGNPNMHLKYLPSIDKTCELMETPNIESKIGVNCPLFSAKVKIWRTNWDWMIVNVSYPTVHIIYR